METLLHNVQQKQSFEQRKLFIHTRKGFQVV
jgi:hypothetical protein